MLSFNEITHTEKEETFTEYKGYCETLVRNVYVCAGIIFVPFM